MTGKKATTTTTKNDSPLSLSSSNKDTMPTEPISEHLTHPRQSFQTLKPGILILPPKMPPLSFFVEKQKLTVSSEPTTIRLLRIVRPDQLPESRHPQNAVASWPSAPVEKKCKEKKEKESEQPSKGGVNDVWVDGRNR